jgi:hypothetical protein
MAARKDYAATPLATKLGARPGIGPKKAAKLETDLDFETVQRIGLDAGLVDNKSASIDERWQALRFVYRLADRAPRAP